MLGPRSSTRVSRFEILHSWSLGRYLQVSNSSFITSHVLFSQTSLLTCFLNSLNQSVTLLTSPSLGLGSYSLIGRRGLRSAQLQLLLPSTHFMFPVWASPFVFSPVLALWLPPTPPPNLPSAGSAGVLVTLLACAKKRHKPAQSALSSTTVPPTGVLIRAVRKEASRSLWLDGAMPPPLSASIVAVSMPLWMGLVLSVVKFSPLSARPGSKTYLMPRPPTRAFLRQPLMIPQLPQPYRQLRRDMAPVSLPQVSLPSLRQSNSFAVHLPSLPSPLPCGNLSGAGSTLFSARTGGDWSEPAPTDDNMEL